MGLLGLAVGGLLALDLFCGGGGAAEGLRNAGFTVVGVDSNPRCGRYYPGLFVCADALEPPVRLDAFDLIWASPPCQRWSPATRGAGDPRRHPDHIPATRRLLAEHPYTIIENVPGAPIRDDVILTGPTVGLDRILRRRHFELSFWSGLMPPPVLTNTHPDVVTITTSMSSSNHFYRRKSQGLPGRLSPAEARAAMGITTEMPGYMVGEAVPPAYAQLLAEAALAAAARSGVAAG